MSTISITWHDPESAGFTDVIPSEWFREEGSRKDVAHRVRGPKGGRYQARCDVTVAGAIAELDYQQHRQYNVARHMLSGVMRLRFADKKRTVVAQVFWRREDNRTFRPYSTTVIRTQAGPSDDGIQEFDGISAPEGRKLLVAHYRRERSRKLRMAKRAAVLQATGTLACEACGFIFEQQYGCLGKDFCEVHHRDPLGVGGTKETELSDLAILCSNCHRMIHRVGWPMPSVHEFSAKYVAGAD